MRSRLKKRMAPTKVIRREVIMKTKMVRRQMQLKEVPRHHMKVERVVQTMTAILTTVPRTGMPTARLKKTKRQRSTAPRSKTRTGKMRVAKI